MAAKHALLIGISSYGQGLQPIPSALKDVEAMKSVLLEPELGGFAEDRVQVLTNPRRTDLDIAIEDFFADKEFDDLLLLYFSGHGFRDENNRQLQLLFGTAESRRSTKPGRRIQTATTLPASIVQRHMADSRSTRQVVVLDCCFSAAFAEGLGAKDEGVIPIDEMLGGKGRAVLTSSDSTETSRFPETGDGLSLYTSFLVEGIQTGSADRFRRGWCDPEDLHLYAKTRLFQAEPRMTPQFFPSKEGGSIRVCSVRQDLRLMYRQKVQEIAEKQNGVITAAGRAILDDLRQDLGLAPDQAKRIEAEVLQPFRDYDAKLARYRATVAATLEACGNQPERLTPQDREELKELEQRLKLRAADVAAIEQELGLHRNEESLQAPRLPRAEEPPERAGIQGPPLIQIPATRGWLVREGNEWRKKEGSIRVKGYVEELAEGVAITMVQIPAGAFLMGSPETEAERGNSEGPQHKVKLRSFFLGQTPVTQAQWKVVADWRKVARDLDPDPSAFKGASRPVECVSWEEAMEFCQRLSKRFGKAYILPSEAQWEYACRAETTTPFAFGETITTDLANYDGNYTYGSGPKGRYREQTSEVGRYPANAWGLQDMHGNVWEWCLDIWHDSYNGAPSDGSAWGSMSDTSSLRLLRGGSWFYHPRNCRSAYRSRLHPDGRGSNCGFRVCCLPQD